MGTKKKEQFIKTARSMWTSRPSDMFLVKHVEANRIQLIPLSNLGSKFLQDGDPQLCVLLFYKPHKKHP